VATITKPITKALYDELRAHFSRIHGNGKLSPRKQREITDRINKIIENRERNFYTSKDHMVNPGSVMKDFKKQLGADSKAEGVVYFMLEDAGIDFEFQKKIGPYRVDYLINQTLILEIDGPHHKNQREYDQKRDEYLTQMGYEVVRVPIWLMASSGKAIIEGLTQ